MNIGGLVFFSVSWAIIILLNIFCFWKIFGARRF